MLLNRYGFCFAPDAGDGGGGNPPDDKRKKKKDDPAKVELTEDELNERVQSAVTSALEEERNRHNDEVEAEKKKAEEDRRKQQGEFQALYDSETAAHKETSSKLEAEKLVARRKDVALMLRDYLSEKHKEYLTAAKWIEPAVTVDLKVSDDELQRRVAKAADAYVKDNPRAVKHGAPEPFRRAPQADDQHQDNPPPQKKELPKPFYMNRR